MTSGNYPGFPAMPAEVCAKLREEKIRKSKSPNISLTICEMRAKKLHLQYGKLCFPAIYPGVPDAIAVELKLPHRDLSDKLLIA